MSDIVQQLEELAALRKLAESPTDWSDGITKQANYAAAALRFDFTSLAAEVKRLREERDVLAIGIRAAVESQEAVDQIRTAIMRACEHDTDGDGNCHLCVNQPEGCLYHGTNPVKG